MLLVLAAFLATKVKYDKSDVLGNDVLEQPNNTKARCVARLAHCPGFLEELGNTAGKNIQTGRTGVENRGTGTF